MLSEKEKRYRQYSIVATVVVTLVAALLFVFLRKNELKVEEYSYKASHVVEDGYQFALDSVVSDGDFVQLAGWIQEDGKEPKLVERELVLKPHSSEDFLKIPTEIVRRPDVSEAKQDGRDYTYSGFFATVDTDDLDLEKEDYTVFVLELSDGETELVQIAPSLKEEINREKQTP